jgi:multidrug efflux pump subunit AcrB
VVAIPFGLVGVIVGFAVHEVPLSFLAMSGIIRMVGVVVNDSFVLVITLTIYTSNTSGSPIGR